MDFSSIKKEFPQSEIYQNHPLAPYTTVKIGGPADIFIHTKSTDEFVSVLNFISKTNAANEANSAQGSEAEGRKDLSTGNSFASLTILGNGSNVLISDSGIRGVVIKNSSKNIEYLPDNQIKVDSGVHLSILITDTINHSLSSLEEFAYIPGTIGGAIFGNIHGVNQNNFDKFVNTIEIFDLSTKSIKKLNSQDLNWNYDTSEFQTHPEWIILSAVLNLKPGNPTVSSNTVADIINKKVETQSMNSLGSVFKNPKNDSAGRIIDQELGLKGFKLNQVQISLKHANFILNLSYATAADYLSVIKKIQSEAKAKGFILEPEIKFLGDFSEQTK
jgi:UDP-N-acetylmuramate dehydrogenase